jgi:hypothetical protein
MIKATGRRARGVKRKVDIERSSLREEKQGNDAQEDSGNGNHMNGYRVE